MPVFKDNEFGFGGLNTRAQSTGLPILQQVVLQDLRVVGTDLIQRKGMVRVCQLTGNQSAIDFTAASSQYLSNAIDVRVWALGLYFTIEVTIKCDATSGTFGIFTAGHTTPAMILDVTSGNYRWRVWDSGANLTTVTVGAATTSTQTIQLMRSGSALTSRLDNVAGGTGTMSATLSLRSPVGDLRVARDDSTNYFDGRFDKLDVLSIVKANHNDRLVRFAAPRAAYCLASYDFDITTGLLCRDRSRYENHLIASATPVEIASLSVNPAPIRGLSQSVDVVANRKQLLAFAGGSAYIADLD